ncbi:hypothetical protein Ptr902_14161 [Pyrenophora tritici-repentis]|nr:hypothetical protein Ptr902_14161 [Pyrenophora tritici-repentis]
MFEEREHEVSKEWEEKLQALHNDHQAAVKYLRGTEKMLTKMKQELDRYKSTNLRLEEELAQMKLNERNKTTEADTAAWDAERTALRSELSKAHDNMEATMLRPRRLPRKSRGIGSPVPNDLELLRRQYSQMEERAREAEGRVQMFLDQFESSVDNYRRQSTIPPTPPIPSTYITTMDMIALRQPSPCIVAMMAPALLKPPIAQRLPLHAIRWLSTTLRLNWMP